MASAPICSPSSATAMSLSSSTREMSITTPGACTRKFQVGQQIGAAGQDFGSGAVLGEQRHGMREVFRRF